MTRQCEYSILWRVRLRAEHQATGNTRQTLGDVVAPLPTELRIVQFENDHGFYLFHCDEYGEEFTDTFHESVDDAKTQANWEFGVAPDEWRKIDQE